MAKYSKAIGATIGAIVAWLAAVGVDTAGLNVDQITSLIVGLGSMLGTYIAPKNAES